MIKRRGFFLVIISLTLGLAAAWLANQWVQNRLIAAEASEEAGARVVAAAVAIPFGAKVEHAHLKVITMPPEAAPEGYFSEPSEVEGQIAMTGVLPGEILLRPRFSEHAAGSTLAAMIKPNMRAITVRVNDVIGLAGFLLPGNHVDVVATRKVDRRAISETILRDINVLAVDQKASTEKDEPVLVRAVTLEMTPEQAEILVKAREEGTIQLTLRNPLEEEPPPVVKDPPKKAAPKPPPQRVVVREPPPPAPTVTVIRGTNVDTTKTRP